MNRTGRDRDPPIEYRLTIATAWSDKLLLALLRRYDLKPYREVPLAASVVVAARIERRDRHAWL